MGSWIWASASCKGVAHANAGTRKQDAQLTKTYGPDDETIGCIVADGAGSARFGGQGASLVCRTIGRHLADQQNRQSGLPTPDEVISWIDVARSTIALCASRRDLASRDFASTLVLAISDGEESLFLHVGDGGIAARSADSGSWICPTWPNQGEYASTTFFVTDDPSPSIRVCRIALLIDALAVFSDGIERLALDFSTCRPHAPFFDAMIQPIDSIDGQHGRSRALSSGLCRFLESSRVNERTDDDKTLVLAARR